MMIIKQLGNNCRLALRTCTQNDKELVNSVKFRKIHYIECWSDDNPLEYFIRTKETPFSADKRFKFDSFDDFQRSLMNEIEGHDYIETMDIKLGVSNSLPTVKLSSRRGHLVKVGLLYISSLNIANYLEQVDPFYLKVLQLSDAPEEVFNISLVQHVNRLMVNECSIRDDQLLEMENRILEFVTCDNLTLKGINKYIQKCVLHLDVKQVDFDLDNFTQIQNFETLLEGLHTSSSIWMDNLGKAIVKSKSDKHQLEIQYSDGNIKMITNLSQHLKKRLNLRNQFTAVDEVEIYQRHGIYKLAIDKKNRISHFSTNTLEELQVKIIEEFEKIDYIKKFNIYNHGLNWKFCSENKQITVGILDVSDGINIVDYLKQIEPIHLKDISIGGTTENQEINDLQKVVEAESLGIYDCRMNDAQLLQLNATRLHLDANGHKNASHSGINAFFKKCLLNLNKYDYNITFTGFINENHYFDIFEGLEVCKSEKTPPLEKVVLDSPYSEYQMEVSIHHDNITAKRIKRYIDNKKG